MGLQIDTHEMKMTAMRGGRIWCFVLCKIFARWVYLNTRMWWKHSDAMRCSRLVDWWCFCICKVCKLFTSTHAWDENIPMRCVALDWLIDDAFVFVKHLQAVYLYTSMRWKHGDSMRCSRLVHWWCVCICKTFASCLHLHTHEMCWVFGDATIFCNNFTRW
jgi:hypothetical protein